MSRALRFRRRLTSSNQERAVVERYQFGVNSYIRKPLDLQEFQEIVRHFGLYRLVVNHAASPAAFTVKNPRRDP
jgi:DNA-binding NarL/FixJ family response regulator